MKIVFVGGGASALFAANLLLEFTDSQITIVTNKPKLGHKLSMTGNGKCNLSPIEDDPQAYNCPEFLDCLLKEIPLSQYLETLERLGIPTRAIRNQGYYPVSENASNVVEILTNSLKKSATIINGEVKDYSLSELMLKSGQKIPFDKLVFATGGKSYPNTGSDGSVFSLLERHGYEIKELKPSLCPIKVKENIKSLFGARNHATMSLIKDNKVIYQEDGEIMFKKDALSGIAIMNMSSFIAREDGNYQIKVDFLMGEKLSHSYKNCLDTLLGYVNRPIAEYILKKYGLKGTEFESEHLKELNEGLTGLTFNYDSLYDFDSAQVTHGGLSLSNIDEHFESRLENSIYFIGEMLNVDGRCGGYNLRFALSSAMKMVKDL